MVQARSTRSGASTNPAAAAAHAGERPERLCPAYKSARSVMVFLGIVLLGVAADLVTKHLAFVHLADSPGRSAEVVPGFLRLTLSTNRGIVFGIEVPPGLVLAATAAAAGVVIFLFATSRRRSWGLQAALAMVLGGSLGNAYDRLFASVWLPGEPAARIRQVRDFIEIDLYFMKWPVFNLADALLVVGVALIILHMLRERRSRSG